MKRKATVESVMVRDITCLPENTSLAEAARRIIGSPQSIFPVVDDQGNYKGMLSTLDLFRPCFPMDRGGRYPDLDAVFADTIGTLAHDENVVLSPNDTLTDAAQTMLGLRVQSLPVVKDGRVIGMLMAKRVLEFLA